MAEVRGTPGPSQRSPLGGVVAVLAVIATALATAADLTVDLPQAAPKWLAWLATIQRVLPPASFFYGFLVACLLVLLTILLLAWSGKRRGVPVAEESQLPPVAIPPTEPQRIALVASESVEQLRQIFNAQQECVGIAVGYLSSHVFQRAQPEEYARLIAKLLDVYALADFKEAYSDLHSRFEAVEFNEAEFADLLDAFNRVTSQYIMIAGWVLWAGQLFFKDLFISREPFLSWRQAHKSFVESLRGIKDWHDLRRIGQTLPGLVNLLPESSPKSES